MTLRILRTRGFTLTEMAVALVIIALLVGGLLIPLSTQKNVEARRDTTRALEQIREALLGFAMAHGRLPCPAAANIASGTANAGFEAYNGTSGCLCTDASSGIAANGAIACNVSDTATVSGVLPWATLGLPETDAWNNRYSYLVTASYARSIGQSILYCDSGTAAPPANAAFALCTSGAIKVLNTSGGVDLTTNFEVPAIIVSHGDNGLGGWNSSGIQKAGAAGDEQANANGDLTFISNSSIDDLLTWISRPVLMNRMITVGKLP